VKPLGRIFLALWLALFAVQASDLVAACAPDDCVEQSEEAAGDNCPDDCARCVCCARVPVFVPHPVDNAPSEARAGLAGPAVIDAVTSAEPRGILHVPRTR
jgi:hypothetical protein